MADVIGSWFYAVAFGGAEVTGSVRNVHAQTTIAGEIANAAGLSSSLVLQANITGTGRYSAAGLYVDVAGKTIAAGGKLEIARFQSSVGGDGSIDLQGRYITRSHAAPADADLAAGDMAVWFDQTNGAAKFMIKAKQADGTVRTGSVALA